MSFQWYITDEINNTADEVDWHGPDYDCDGDPIPCDWQPIRTARGIAYRCERCWNRTD